jgi:16S rRNA C967 or C1407 C5-methylase (RsmB/RsmF family)/NOL1/NOP2/fmu family ribosome biogenesis protein
MVFPEAFINRLKTQDYIDSESLLSALKEPSPVSIRMNRRKWDRTPKDSEQVPWCSDGYYLKRRPSFILDPLFHAGAYYPQEASGMFLEQIFRQIINPQDNLRILDLCGAPGGKSTHLSSLLYEKGLLVANEVIRARAAILRENLTKWGLSNSIVSQSDPVIFGKIPGFFDIILVDAPCSGEGMFRDAVAVAEWSEKNTRLCSDRQKRILMDVWPALKKNGILIYSTCTFNPEENERNIKWFSDQGEFESIKLDVSEFNGITVIDYNGIYGYGFYPGKIKGEGLFISVLRKTEGDRTDDRLSRTLNINRLTKEEFGIIEKWTLFDPQAAFKTGDELIAPAGLPPDIGRLAGKIKVIRWGTSVCTRKGNSFIPSHELALSASYKKGSFPEIDLDIGKALDYLGRKDLKGVTCNKGWNVFRYRSMNLGFANNIGTRINNYYPAGWRIKYADPVSAPGKIMDWE